MCLNGNLDMTSGLYLRDGLDKRIVAGGIRKVYVPLSFPRKLHSDSQAKSGFPELVPSDFFHSSSFKVKIWEILAQSSSFQVYDHFANF